MSAGMRTASPKGKLFKKGNSQKNVMKEGEGGGARSTDADNTSKLLQNYNSIFVLQWLAYIQNRIENLN
jgi:hypothetical protein